MANTIGLAPNQIPTNNMLGTAAYLGVDQINASALPVGSIVQVPYYLTDTNWLPCLGQRLVRTQYPALAACVPSIGVFTPTTRTKSAASASGALCADSTNWISAGAVGTTNIYTSPDGVTWTGRTTPASTDTRSLINDGTNIIGIGPANAIYSTNGGSTWTASASSPGTGASAIQDCMALAPSLGTVGRLCATNNATGFWTSDDRGVTWTSRTTSSPNIFWHVCWTGTKFIALNSSFQAWSSSDGITWARLGLTVDIGTISAQNGSIASDGNGLVVIACNNGGLLVSTDHGATWTVRVATYAGVATVCRSNGRFFVSQSNGNLLVSIDALTWVSTNDMRLFDGSYASPVAYKSGVYMTGGFGINTCLTMVEDTTQMVLPSAPMAGTVNLGMPALLTPWIKVR